MNATVDCACPVCRMVALDNEAERLGVLGLSLVTLAEEAAQLGLITHHSCRGAL